MSTNLKRISLEARAHPDLVCTSLYQHIAAIDHVRSCYHLLKGNKAVGVDEVTTSIYMQRSGGESTRCGRPPQADGLPASAEAPGVYPEARQ